MEEKGEVKHEEENAEEDVAGAAGGREQEEHGLRIVL